MSYTRLRYHLVWATQDRSPVITPALEDVIYPALHNKAQEQKARLLKIGGAQDHLHLVAALRPTLALADFAREVKTASSRAVNTSGLLEGRFHWQRGYGAFTLDPLDLSGVLRYVANQKRHHAEGTVCAAYERLRQGLHREGRAAKGNSGGALLPAASRFGAGGGSQVRAGRWPLPSANNEGACA